MPSHKSKFDAKQIAALPVALNKKKEFRILMVSSRDSGRWIIPKGWLMRKKAAWQAAEIEALEEAGALGLIGRKSLGKYTYTKNMGNGAKLIIRVSVYPLIVNKLKKRWKEADYRKRRWFSAQNAAKSIEVPELKEILIKLKDNQKRSKYKKFKLSHIYKNYNISLN